MALEPSLSVKNNPNIIIEEAVQSFTNGLCNVFSDCTGKTKHKACFQPDHFESAFD